MADNDRARRAGDDVEDDFESEVPPAITFPPEVVTPDAVHDPDRGEYIGAVRAGLTIAPEVTVEPGASEGSSTSESAATTTDEREEAGDVEVEVAAANELEPLEADSLGDQGQAIASPRTPASSRWR